MLLAHASQLASLPELSSQLEIQHQRQDMPGFQQSGRDVNISLSENNLPVALTWWWLLRLILLPVPNGEIKQASI